MLIQTGRQPEPLNLDLQQGENTLNRNVGHTMLSSLLWILVAIVYSGTDGPNMVTDIKGEMSACRCEMLNMGQTKKRE